ncbi:MAG TPA: phage holin family protein [Acidimicrobiia bacterium]
MTVQQPSRPDESLGTLFSDLSRDLSALMRDEVRLAKTEITEDAGRMARAGGMLGAAGFAGYMVIVLLSFAAAWGLAGVVPIGVAFLIVGVVWAAAAAVLFGMGRQRLRTANLRPDQTIETMQENVQWAKQQKS